MITRRVFIGGSTALAAGTALGIVPNIRKTAPTTISVLLFRPEPALIPAQVFSEDDRFGIHVGGVALAAGPGEGTTIVLPLRDVQSAVAAGGCKVRQVQAEVRKLYNLQVEREELTVNLEVLRGGTFKVTGQSGAFWMPLKDVESVL